MNTQTHTQNSRSVAQQQSAPMPSVKEFLASKKAVIGQSLEGTALTPERLLSVVMTEIRKTPALADCELNSLFGAIVQSAQLGLEPGSALGHCYLIPFKNKTKKITECQFMIGYRGMVELARRSGQVQSISAREVYENDQFSITYGLHEDMIHVPAYGKDRGRVVGYYSVAHLVGGGLQFDFMDMVEIEGIKSRSAAAAYGSSPWQTDPVAMGKKSVVRRLFKLLPVSVQALMAVTLDEQGERGEQSNGALIDHKTGEVLEKQATNGSSANALNQLLS